MKPNLFVALIAAMLLSACQHGANTSEDAGPLVPGAFDGYRVLADAPGRSEEPRLLVIRPPNQADVELRVAGYSDPRKLDVMCVDWAQCGPI